MQYILVHSSAYNFEILHHTRAVKSSTAVIFENTKHIVDDDNKDKLYSPFYQT